MKYLKYLPFLILIACSEKKQVGQRLDSATISQPIDSLIKKIVSNNNTVSVSLKEYIAKSEIDTILNIQTINILAFKIKRGKESFLDPTFFINMKDSTVYHIPNGNLLENFETRYKEVQDFSDFGTDGQYFNYDIVGLNGFLNNITKTTYYEMYSQKNNYEMFLNSIDSLLSFHHQTLLKDSALYHFKKALSSEDIVNAGKNICSLNKTDNTFKDDKYLRSLNYVLLRYEKGYSVVYYNNREILLYELMFRNYPYCRRIILYPNNNNPKLPELKNSPKGIVF